MGIKEYSKSQVTGLLPLIKESLLEINLEEYRGQTIAVDTYVWLHKGLYSCTSEIIANNKTNGYVSYCQKMIDLLLSYEIKPYLVFDGQYLPAKKEKETERETKRKMFREKGLKYKNEGNAKEAFLCFQKSIEVTPFMAYEIIQICLKQNIKFVVAPYEADAQLAFLLKKEIVSAVLTEDSDLILFGCHTILFKLNYTGNVMEYKQERLTLVQDKGIRFQNWSLHKFRQMCILSGCDYLESICGMGIKTAYNFISKYEKIEHVVRVLNMSSKWIVPESYLHDFRKAEAVFKYQRVFDTSINSLVTLNEISEELSYDIVEDYIGKNLSPINACGIANGELDPFTQLPFDTNSLTSLDTLPKKKSHIPGQSRINRFFEKKSNKSLIENKYEERIAENKDKSFKLIQNKTIIESNIRNKKMKTGIEDHVVHYKFNSTLKNHTTKKKLSIGLKRRNETSNNEENKSSNNSTEIINKIKKYSYSGY